MFKKFAAFLRGGTCSLNKQETLLLSAVINELPSDEAEILSKQLSLISLVQRHSSSSLVAAYYPKHIEIPLLPYDGYEYCLANVRYTLNNQSKTTYIVLHEGKFMSIERRVPLKDDNIENIIAVNLHPKDYKPAANDIDSEEHKDNA